MDRKEKILKLAKEMGIIRPRDVEAVGIPREHLLRLYRKGDLVRVRRGLYALPGSLTSESVTLAEIAKRIPNAVVCLALGAPVSQSHNTISCRVWIAVEGRKWKPKS